MTKQVLETGLKAELTEALGYEAHGSEGRDGGNSRNGTRSKTLLTEIGPVLLDVPRDREGPLEAKLITKRPRLLHGDDEMVLALAAKGLTPGEVSTHLAEVYGVEVSRETASRSPTASSKR